MNLSWRALLFCVLAVASVVTASGSQGRAVQSDQQTLIQLERDWNQALRNKDVRFIGKVLADEFVVITAEGRRSDKAQELAQAAKFDQQIDSTTLDEFTVKVYGNTAVVWFREHLVGPSQGRRLEVTYRYTDVFVRRAGRWQCVASQSTKVAS